MESNSEVSQVWKRHSLPELKYPKKEFKGQSKDYRTKIVMPPLREVITKEQQTAVKLRKACNLVSNLSGSDAGGAGDVQAKPFDAETSAD